MKMRIIGLMLMGLLLASVSYAQTQQPITVTVTLDAAKAADLKAALVATLGRGGPGMGRMSEVEVGQLVLTIDDAAVVKWLTNRVQNDIADVLRQADEMDTRTIDLSGLTAAQRAELKKALAAIKVKK